MRCTGYEHTVFLNLGICGYYAERGRKYPCKPPRKFLFIAIAQSRKSSNLTCGTVVLLKSLAGDIAFNKHFSICGGIKRAVSYKKF
ncbi:MAG: hypothetical protein LBC13_02080, partial [Clostridiales bacterium]|nr:hypothetical protein [Clostridiales bacterium]